MKTKQLLFSLIFVLVSMITYAETIAVANFSTTGLHATPEIAGKLARLELTKLQKHTVLDEFDMNEILSKKPEYVNCYGKSCLVELGKDLNVDYILSGSVDGLGNKIVVTLKLIDVKNNTLKSTHSQEFLNQEEELQRMIALVLQETFGVDIDPTVKSKLEFKNDVITSSNVGKLSNAGPRMGLSYVAFGELNTFFTRNENQGGLGIKPIMSNLGYQFEAQYIGTENFSALGELILNIGGMEQGQFIPSISILNGFRFGNNGWEFAFGPSIGLRKTSLGLVDADGVYYTANQWRNGQYDLWKQNPANFDPVSGDPISAFQEPNASIYTKSLDKRGETEINASWIMAFGRTFKAGALNIPVNVYYSSNKFGGIIGTSIGFNITKTKSSIR